MRFGLDVAQQRLDWDEIVRRAQLAERLGFDGVWGFDHFQPMYGQGPGNCFEGLTTLAALSGVTARVRLGLLVTGVTYRHPSVLAAEAVTIDHASHGRLELALGSAWYEGEHEALGIDFPRVGARADMLDDAVEMIVRLLSGERVIFDGRRFRLRNAQLLPVPVQRPHPPIWIGGTGPRRTLPTAARRADVWHSFGNPESLRDPSATLSRLAEEAGRDPASILRASSLSLSDPLDDIQRKVDAWRDAGFGYLVCGWPSDGDERVEAFADAFFR